jgi:outer membrane protein TolC
MVLAGKEFKGALPDMYEVMIGVEIPLFYKKKQANLLEESVSRLSGARQDLNAMKNDVNAMLAESFIMAKTAENLIKLYKEKIIPQSALALESSLANYQTNKTDFLMVLSAINGLVSTEIDYVKNLTSLWSAAAKIEELTSLEIVK